MVFAKRSVLNYRVINNCNRHVDNKYINYNSTPSCPIKKILDEKIQRNPKILPLIK